MSLRKRLTLLVLLALGTLACRSSAIPPIPTTQPTPQPTVTADAKVSLNVWRQLDEDGAQPGERSEQSAAIRPGDSFTDNIEITSEKRDVKGAVVFVGNWDSNLLIQHSLLLPDPNWRIQEISKGSYRAACLLTWEGCRLKLRFTLKERGLWPPDLKTMGVGHSINVTTPIEESPMRLLMSPVN